MKALRLKIYRRQDGHTLIEVLVALGLIGLLLVAVSQFVDFSTAFQRINVSIGSQEKMRVVRSAIMQAAKDVDSDGYYELLLPELGALVPSSLNLGSYANDEWGTPFLYCAYDVGKTNTVDSAYVSNSPPFAPDYPLGRIISAGKDKTFQTTCVDSTVLGDDIVLQITEADVRHANGGFGGFSHQTGEIKPVTPSDNINLQKSLVTPGNFNILPLVDPQGNTIKPGTLGYQTTVSPARGIGLYIHDGLTQFDVSWHTIGHNWPLRENICYNRMTGYIGKATFCQDVYGPGCSSSMNPNMNSPGYNTVGVATYQILWSCSGSYSSPPAVTSCVQADGTYGQVSIAWRGAVSAPNNIGAAGPGVIDENFIDSISNGVGMLWTYWVCQ